MKVKLFKLKSPKNIFDSRVFVVDIGSVLTVCVSQEAAEERTAHNNGWNGEDQMALNKWKPCV